MNEKEIKRQIRELRKLKLQLKSGTPQRIKLHREIKRLKEKLKTLNTIAPEKKEIINKILKLEPIYKRIKVNLNKFTIEQLEKHYQRIKNEIKLYHSKSRKV